jgi:hypothetical protein
MGISCMASTFGLYTSHGTCLIKWAHIAAMLYGRIYLIAGTPLELREPKCERL